MYLRFQASYHRSRILRISLLYFLATIFPGRLFLLHDEWAGVRFCFFNSTRKERIGHFQSLIGIEMQMFLISEFRQVIDILVWTSIMEHIYLFIHNEDVICFVYKVHLTLFLSTNWSLALIIGSAFNSGKCILLITGGETRLLTLGATRLHGCSRSREFGSRDTARGDVEEVCSREVVNVVEERTKAAIKR
jgi:hypothetical protein